jgi:hypothetical protein
MIDATPTFSQVFGCDVAQALLPNATSFSQQEQNTRLMFSWRTLQRAASASADVPRIRALIVRRNQEEPEERTRDRMALVQNPGKAHEWTGSMRR